MDTDGGAELYFLSVNVEQNPVFCAKRLPKACSILVVQCVLFISMNMST